MAIFVEVRPLDNKRDAMFVFRWRSDQLDRSEYMRHIARLMDYIKDCEED